MIEYLCTLLCTGSRKKKICTVQMNGSISRKRIEADLFFLKVDLKSLHCEERELNLIIALLVHQQRREREEDCKEGGLIIRQLCTGEKVKSIMAERIVSEIVCH